MAKSNLDSFATPKRKLADSLRQTMRLPKAEIAALIAHEERESGTWRAHKDESADPVAIEKRETLPAPPVPETEIGTDEPPTVPRPVLEAWLDASRDD